MNDSQKTVRDSVMDWIAFLGVGLRMALLSAANQRDDQHSKQDSGIDSDFEGWLHNDPMVTGNPACRYGEDAPGYLTRNGFGSLEVGASDD
jgi:hypothetical protein